MKNSLSKNFKKKTNKIYSYDQLATSGSDTTNTIIGDPTNTTITVLTTVSGQVHLGNHPMATKIRA